MTDSTEVSLGIISGLTDPCLGNVAIAPGAQSVAVDPVSDGVIVPLGAGTGNTICPGGCVAPFATAVPELRSVTLLAVRDLGLAGVGGPG
ncbi:MAG: hypothetical protein ACREFY_12040, partial [Acetobacteraceae bacterium]